ncbi:MAG: phosphotransferase family protein [Candidatus Hodarchaeales archaeon]|jgi:aminoglycoside phosphotransferase (APT) family kinase protein
MSKKEIKELLGKFLRENYSVYDNLEIKDFKHITEGWETHVYSYKQVFEKDHMKISENRILRIYPGKDSYYKSKKEFNVIKKLYELKYAVPEVYILENQNSPFNQPFIIMERIDGPLMGETFSNSYEVQKEFCKLFVDLHSLDWKHFVSDYSLYESNNILKIKLEEFREIIMNFNLINFLPVMNWLDDGLRNIDSIELGPIHFDFHPFNIILRDPDMKPFVIDWGGFEIIDYRVDLAWTLLLVSTFSSPQMRDIILKEYERVRGFQVKNIEYFDVIACVRRLFSIVVSVNEGAEELGMRPEAGEKMRKELVHIKNVYQLLQERTNLTIRDVNDLISQLESQ